VIDASNIKAAGWQRVVAELTAPAHDDRVFMERLVRVLAQVSAARQAVLYTPTTAEGQMVEPKAEMVWPPVSGEAEAMAAGRGGSEGASAGRGPGGATIEFSSESKAAARGAIETGQSRVFSLDKQELYYDSGSGAANGFVLAVPLHQYVSGAGGVPANAVQVAVVGVVCLVIEPRGKDAVRSTMAMAEVIAGYMHGHAARQSLRRTQHASIALDLGTRLIGAINTASNFKGACIQLVNDLAKQFQLDRVAMGWVEHDATKVKAISDVEHFSRHTQMVQKLASAMDECLDQEQPVMHPAPPGEGAGADVLLSQAISHAHRELAAGNAKMKVCSLPLRADEDVIGVVTLESAGEGAIDVNSVELMQAALDLVAPVLKIRRSDDRNMFLRAWDDALKAGAWAVGPKHTVWKLVGVLALAGLLFVTLYRTTYRPGAEATLEPRVRRIVSAPLDGVVKRVSDGAQSGKLVQAGDVLVELDSTEWQLRLVEAESKIAQARTQAAAARAARQQNKVIEAEQQETQAAAEADSLRERISRSKIVAPIAGTVIAGDMNDKVGGAIKLGDQMFQIADLSDILITARVDERDIALVKQAFDQSRGKGEFATKGRPDQGFAFDVERIVPLAAAVEGKNVFEVRGKLSGSAEWFRPGMEGIAKFETERMSLLRIGTRRIVDQVRLWLWWW
jgi:biotin carboxyl carrier protein